MHLGPMLQVARAHVGGLSLQLSHAQARVDWEIMAASAAQAAAAEACSRLALLTPLPLVLRLPPLPPPQGPLLPPL